MKISSVSKLILESLKNVTVEPVIFFLVLGMFILYGAQVPTNILMYKVCRFEMNHTDAVCENLGDPENTEIEQEVQIEVNNFQTKAQLITTVPAVVFALYAGPISDRSGQKPLILLPLIGFVFTALSGVLTFTFIETIPIEFFYFESAYAFFGGLPVYYLGIYNYGAMVSKPEDRAHRIAILDGVETLATLTGTLLSPVVAEHLGFYGNYGFFGGFTLLAALYLFFIVKEVPAKPKTASDQGQVNQKASVAKSIFVDPILEMVGLATKKREPIMKRMILLQCIIYCINIFGFYSMALLYFFMLIQFDGFTAADYAYFSVATSLGNTFFLVIVMPIASGKLRINDTVLLICISVAETVSYMTMPFITNLPLFYLMSIIGSMGYCKFALGRSLLSKTCEEDETGKLFSVLSIFGSLAILGVNPITRTLYNETVDTFPGAFLLLSGSLIVVAGLINIYFFSKRQIFRHTADPREEIKDKIDLAGIDSTYFRTYI